MMLDLQIVGPGFASVQRLLAGEPELIVGRDASCGICLPDPERNVSRRHLALWNDMGQLRFRVLSTVNGVELPMGYAPPGAQGTLPAGQTLKVGDYMLHLRPEAAAEADPWAQLDRGGMADATLPRAALTVGRRDEVSGPAILPEEDPFNDWSFESAFGPSAAGDLGAMARGPGSGDLFYLYQGLGLDRALAALTPAELEAAGRAIRIALTGLLELYAERSGAEEAGSGDGVTLAPVRDNNPLKTRWPESAKLQYLFGGRAASTGFINPQRALTEIVTELKVHDKASAAAARAAVQATVEEFAPAALKDRLIGSGSKLFEGARVWDAYSRYYAERSQRPGEWARHLLDQHFQQAYLREIERITGETDRQTD